MTQRVNPDADLGGKERKKIEKAISFGYLVFIGWSLLKSVMHYFSVTKGDDDIRMVYDGTKSGINAATWVPWFAIPTNSTLERVVVVPGTKQADNEL
jgi:hypothetical protein